MLSSLFSLLSSLFSLLSSLFSLLSPYFFPFAGIAPKCAPIFYPTNGAVLPAQDNIVTLTWGVAVDEVDGTCSVVSLLSLSFSLSLYLFLSFSLSLSFFLS